MRHRRPLVPFLGPHGNAHDRKHDGYLDEDADDGCERRAGVETEQHDRGGDCEFEEITRADKCKGAATQWATPSWRLSR